MLKILWKSLLVSPAFLATALTVSSAATAAEDATTAQADLNPTAQIELAQAQQDELLDKLETYSNEGDLTTNDQVTSVSELRDVSPTEWAYEALRSLVERYGCIVGYPDRTFRGNRALTRWEFAAGLNACLNTMERLIQENVAVLREDIDKLKRLMQEFEAELAALGARVDNLEGRVAFLEDHQFSTTTKLSGEVIFGVTGAFGDSDGNNQTVFQDRVRLRLNTTFSGEDLLVTRLSAGNAELFKLQADIPYQFFDPVTGEQVDNNFFVTDDITSPATTQTFQNTRTNNDVILDWLAYYAPIRFSENFKLDTYVAAWGGLWYDFVPTINPFFEDYDGGKGSLSIFAQRNPIYSIGGGTGAGLSLQLGFLEQILGPSSLSFGYLAGGNANDPSQGFGLFNGNYAALGQLNANLFDFLNIGVTYVHAYSKPESPLFGAGSFDGLNGDGTGFVGTSAANLSTTALDNLINSGTFNTSAGVTTPVDASTYSSFNPQNSFLDGFGGKVTNSYGIQAAISPAPWISLSAFGSYTDVILVNKGDGEIWTYGGGIAFPDLGKEGNILGIFAGVQPYFGGTNLLGSLGSQFPLDDSLPIHVELFYKYQVTDNLSLTPGVIWLSRPEQIQDSTNEWIGTLRGTFTF